MCCINSDLMWSKNSGILYILYSSDLLKEVEVYEQGNSHNYDYDKDNNYDESCCQATRTVWESCV